MKWAVVTAAARRKDNSEARPAAIPLGVYGQREAWRGKGGIHKTALHTPHPTPHQLTITQYRRRRSPPHNNPAARAVKGESTVRCDEAQVHPN
ncbi:hypothetical protein E2C01_070198 [Portunus trituberculatus]|uniref:Uncharacterized protein n=1 Tax=Portunus trituberculatus TaxID=210409 RepID=A0A5B7HWM5_PORTR|nr:hypothetical protein [Portunus trituberculatus]